jgi:hypothetical protein
MILGRVNLSDSIFIASLIFFYDDCGSRVNEEEFGDKMESRQIAHGIMCVYNREQRCNDSNF